MPIPTPVELKKQLIAAGLEVFRVQGNRVHLAERVRENLIMDGGVAAVVADQLAVRFIVRAQASHFPGEAPPELFTRARALAAPSTAQGYAEVDTAVVTINDPGGGIAALDTWYEVTFEKPVGESDLIGELRYALGVEKVTSGG
jgi:hypothetical protein